MSDLAAAARWYSEHGGFKVFPVEPRGKRPLTEHGHLDASADPSRIAAWWQQWPDANIGLPCEPNGLLVIDLDPRNGAPDRDGFVEAFGDPGDTAEVETGSGGRHIFFRHPGGAIPATLGPGIDCKSAGYVVAPPSTHPSGREYSVDGLDGAKAFLRIAEAPAWLLERIRAASTNSNGAGHREPLPDRIPKGVQHVTLVSFAGKLRELGLTDAEIFPSLMAVNEGRCSEPGTPENIRKIAASMMRYSPGDSDLFKTASKLWRVTAAREHEQARNADPKAQPAPAVSGMEIYSMSYPETVFVADPILPTGLTIFAARPKVGKSWAALQLALSVASGADFLERFPVRAGRVIYFALEEPPRRTHSRIHALQPTREPWLDNLHFIYDLAPLLAGGAAQIDAYLAEHPAQLVVIDTLLAIVQASAKRDAMRSDYAETNVLRELADKHNCAILLVAHTRKATAEYALDAVAGTSGVTAGADCIWTLTRTPGAEVILEVRGRESEEQAYALVLDKDPVGWRLTGSGELARLTVERTEILELLRDEAPLKPAKVAASLRKNVVTTRRLLQKLLSDDWVTRNSDGGYCLSQRGAAEVRSVTV
ncbi:MAG: bifunctional DNA primase/polymerase [Bryobacterales bacterium]|nr:bifunctional DNA primase/polymerase [Bryobacterales bacterium]